MENLLFKELLFIFIKMLTLDEMKIEDDEDWSFLDRYIWVQELFPNLFSRLLVGLEK